MLLVSIAACLLDELAPEHFLALCTKDGTMASMLLPCPFRTLLIIFPIFCRLYDPIVVGSDNFFLIQSSCLAMFCSASLHLRSPPFVLCLP